MYIKFFSALKLVGCYGDTRANRAFPYMIKFPRPTSRTEMLEIVEKCYDYVIEQGGKLAGIKVYS